MATILLITALVLSSPIAEQKRDWKEAKILDVKQVKKTDFQTGDPRSGGSLNAVIEMQYWTYVVDLNGTRYELQEQNTKPTFEVGDTLRFAIEKGTWYFTDKKGKEKRGEVVGRKEPKPASKPVAARSGRLDLFSNFLILGELTRL